MILSAAFILFGISASGQTYFYRRIKTVDESTGRQTARNDDAHYITFTSKGAYWSDKEGFAQDGRTLTYQGVNSGADTYTGNSFLGSGTLWRWSNGRINHKIGNTVHVYERCSASTNAARRRKAPVSPNPGPSVTPAVTPEPFVPGRVRYRKVRKQCTVCKGKGYTHETIEPTVQYVGSPDPWCEKCHRYMYAHYHKQHMCQRCYSKGWYEEDEVIR